MCGGSLAHAGLIITPTFDSSITSDPNAASIESTINQAINFYETTYSNPVKVNILFKEMSSGLGLTNKLDYNIGYTNFRNGLVANQAISGQTDQQTALNNLPTGPNNPVTGNTMLGVKSPDARVFGQSTPFLYDSCEPTAHR